MPLPLVYHPDYVSPLPDGHRFPMPKFGKLYDVLLRDGVATLDQFHCAPVAQVDWLRLAHDPGYVDSYLNGTIDDRQMRRIGLPWSPSLVCRTRVALGGSVLAAELALASGLACNLAGGTHHAHSSFGAGYCIFNDLAVTARLLLELGRVRRVLIVDLDVHQGDGTAEILHGDDRIFTLSLHCGANFPFRKQSSDLDVDLPPGLDDAGYLKTLGAVLPPLLDDQQPDLVLYDAGVDPHADDLLGKLALSDDGLRRRDAFVLDECLRRSIPVACVIGGGYDHDHERLARRHSIIHRVAGDQYQRYRL